MDKSIWKFITLNTLLVMAFITLTYFVVNEEFLSLDQLLIKKVQLIETDFLTQIMKVFHFIGSTIPVIFISCTLLLIVYKLYKRSHEVFLFLIVIIGSTVINQLTKFLTKRDRPLSELIVETGYSFPSGHAMAAVSLYGVISFLFWKHLKTSSGRAVLILFSTVMIIVMGFSRVYLSVHYPSDIVGAFLLSGIWLYVTIWLFQFVMERKKSE